MPPPPGTRSDSEEETPINIYKYLYVHPSVAQRRDPPPGGGQPRGQSRAGAPPCRALPSLLLAEHGDFGTDTPTPPRQTKTDP